MAALESSESPDSNAEIRIENDQHGAEISSLTPAGESQTMAGNVSQTASEQTTDEQRASRKRHERSFLMSSVESERHDAKRRAILAATEFLAGGKGSTGLGVSELQAKHGVHHRRGSAIYREAANIEGDAGMQAGLAMLAEAVPEVLTNSAEIADGGSVGEQCTVCSSKSDTEQDRRACAMATATQAVAQKTHTVEEACRMAEKKHSSPHLNRETVRRRARSHPGLRPLPRGRQQVIPREEEEKLVCLVEAMRAMKIAVYRSTLIFMANKAIEGTVFAQRFKHGRVSEKWYRRFSRTYKHRLVLKNQQKLEMARDKWSTSENLEIHYQILIDLLLELGFADLNPNFDPSIPFDAKNPGDTRCQPVFVKSEFLLRIFSFDETEASTDMSGGSKSFGRRFTEKTFAARELGDQGHSLTNKTSHKATMIGGSCAAGYSMRPMVIFNQLPMLHWLEGAPTSTFVCSTPTGGKQHTALFAHSENGGTTKDIFIDFLRRNFVDSVNEETGEPLFENGRVLEVSKELPIILICDGHGSHIDLEVLDFCRAHRIHLVLRPPHTSHITQVEDVANFGVFKEALRIANKQRLTDKALSCIRDTKKKLPYMKLDNSDLMECVHDAWMKAFDRGRCLTGWAMVGIAPFTRKLFWKLKAQEGTEERVVDNCERTTGLNFQYFTLKQVSEATVSRTHAGGEAVGRDDQGEDGVQQPQGRKGMNSSKLWKRGAVTCDEARNMVAAYIQEREQERGEKDKRAKEREAQREAARMQAAGACEEVKRIVREKGWVTGGQGKLTRALLEQVIVWFNQPKLNKSVAEQVERVKQMLGWREGSGFPDAAIPAPPPPDQGIGE